MTIGTKTVLFGAHQFLLHPWFVAWAWWELYGFPWDPRLWVAFFVHDLGYIGKPDLDGEEGEQHPVLGAKIMHALFDRGRSRRDHLGYYPLIWLPRSSYWYDFMLLHSRFFAKKLQRPYSRLCVADKLAISLTPSWLYLPLVNLTGEIALYRKTTAQRTNEQWSDKERSQLLGASQREWHKGVQAYCRRWAYAHRDGAADTWTP